MQAVLRWFAILLLPLGALLAAAPRAELPYRFLVVINDQWRDPASEVIQERDEFSMLCALLRSWGLPFDIYRLDQQRFDAYHLLDRDGRPLHGTIIWNAPGAVLNEEAAGLLRSFVRNHGVGLVAFSDTIATPVLAELTGVRAKGNYESEAPLAAVDEHFIVRGVSLNPLPPPVPKMLKTPWTAATTPLVTGLHVTLEAASTVVTRDGHPLLTARQLPTGGRVAWLDVERKSGQIFRQAYRDLIKRALVWTNGYALYAEYPRSAVLFMDDMGASDKTYYSGWHYPSMSEELIRTRLIEPLQRHGAVLAQNVNAGWLDRKSQRVLNPWKQSRVVDELDPQLVHDFASTKRGLDAGIKAGVFEIQSHGWTHMIPDLDSPPGPFWSAPATSPIVQLNWYKEFGDVVRKIEIPASVQRVHIQRALDDLAADFGVRPIMLRCGGGTSSVSAPNNTMRLAAKMGFGLAHAERHYYLDQNVCIPLDPVTPQIGWNFTLRLPDADVPWTIDGPCWIGFHDRDVAMDGKSFDQLLTDLGPGVRYMTYAEYSAYLHTRAGRQTNDEGLTLTLTYDPHESAYFGTHESRWTLHVADETRTAMNLRAEKKTVVVRPGTGRHVVRAD